MKVWSSCFHRVFRLLLTIPTPKRAVYLDQTHEKISPAVQEQWFWLVGSHLKPSGVSSCSSDHGMGWKGRVWVPLSAI